MSSKALYILCLLVSPLMMSGAVSRDIRAPGGGSIRLDSSVQGRVKVTTDYWRLEFDLRRGGALDTIVYQHGSRKNLLVEPLRAYVDHWSDWNAAETSFRSSQDGDVVRLVYSGNLAATGRVPGPVSFESRWTLSPFVVRFDCTLRFAGDLLASSVGVASTTLRSDLNEFSLRPGVSEGPDGLARAPLRYGGADTGSASLILEHHIPLHMLFAHRGMEGLEFNPASDISAWENRLTGSGGLASYSAELDRNDRVVCVRQEPLRTTTPVRIRKGDYTFSQYLGLSRIVERTNRKWRHLSFGNRPWPTDEEIHAWAESGVNIVRLHNDYSDDGVFWRDGAWPPYGSQGMAEMRRVIAACHRYMIKIVPYFSIYELHPEAEGFAENVEKWKRTTDAAGTVLHHHVLNGEYGAEMCPLSGWLDRRKHDVEKAYRELGFDGIYYDWMESLPCSNKAHASGLHLGIDGVIDLLAWTRRLIGPGGVLFLHSSDRCIAFENFGDVLITMEDIAFGRQEMLRLQDIPITELRDESVPRVPCPSYRPDRNRERNQNNIALWVALGVFPMWRATGPSEAAAGGPGYDLTLRLFRTFKPYQLENYRLHNVLSGEVRTGWEDVYGALYTSPEQALVVLSNSSAEERRNVSWRVDPNSLCLGTLARISLKDVTSGKSQVLNVGTLKDGSPSVNLEGYEYCLFEIRPAR